jgi:hypothetical protein
MDSPQPILSHLLATIEDDISLAARNESLRKLKLQLESKIEDMIEKRAEMLEIIQDRNRYIKHLEKSLAHFDNLIDKAMIQVEGVGNVPCSFCHGECNSMQPLWKFRPTRPNSKNTTSESLNWVIPRWCRDCFDKRVKQTKQKHKELKRHPEALLVNT